MKTVMAVLHLYESLNSESLGLAQLHSFKDINAFKLRYLMISAVSLMDRHPGRVPSTVGHGNRRSINACRQDNHH